MTWLLLVGVTYVFTLYAVLQDGHMDPDCEDETVEVSP